MIALRRALAAAIVAAIALGGCGDSASKDLVVSAAASLKSAFTDYGRHFASASARFSFGGSDLLAAQIEHGVHPDVFASANLVLPARLYAQGLVERPVAFAANRLVIAVPAHSSRVRSLGDLLRPGVTIAIGTATVPVGAYTRQVLARLGPEGHTILARARSQEPDVSGIAGKLIEGAADAGFLYATDVTAAKGALRAIDLPARLQPQVQYGVAVVKGSSHAALAREFIAGLLAGPGRVALRAAGFQPPGR